ncbi:MULTISPECIES: HAD family hydrolase [Leptospira]|uniref:phosphoglycolate phosphatase n=4 Tax=Leptospira santarosai TaxID=28183 RepID=M6UL25_9LEPT|nr:MULTISPECIES: HAD family hydrolase [Leptospira]AVV49880.1 Haloacid dehalogenase-like hydrolase [Leptospira santarosai]AVV79369.1 Haloacid dehalogenase-like hydrolase [Leptospira santarosai]EKO80242.1 haloacid dehalogenase-like hydrolase [Leptospira sp. Fiocruz LV3954]EKS09129.1 haloacid dehalogenase-like hydrolase [Leptospira santarosai str. JET]EKT88476.1 phosphatase [Leptospira santarosai serovar Shermani str. LT 821]
MPKEPVLRDCPSMTDFSVDSLRALAFDVDGTLFSSEGIILEVYTDSIRNFSETFKIRIDLPSRDQVMMEIGKPVKTIFRNLLPQLNEEQRDTISDSVLRFLCERIKKGEGEFYPTVKKTIESLARKGFKILAASNGRKPYIETILEVAGVLSYFDPILVLDNERIKTKGEILKEYVKRNDLKPNEILMIGDRLSDHEAARQNGCPFAFCSYGHAPPGEIPDFELELKNLSDLNAIL